MIEIPHPRDATALFGHEAAEAEFMAAREAGRLHHAWLISGPKGIGKATLAYRFTRLLLAGGNASAERRIAAGSHADLLVLEPPFDTEKDEAKREIPVELARQAGEFMAFTPAEGDWRVVVVDSVDEMNPNAANALLKTLEEPPARAVLLLVSHNPGRLLPTIRSRCRMLKLAPLNNNTFHEVMNLHAPEADAGDVKLLGLLSRHSPGVALALLSHECVDLYEKIVQAVGQGGRASVLLESITGTATHTRWQMLGQLVARFFERTVEYGLGNAPFTEAVPGEEAVMRALLAAHSLAALSAMHAAALEQFSVAARLHLDYKTVLLTFMDSLARPRAA